MSPDTIPLIPGLLIAAVLWAAMWVLERRCRR